MLTHLGVDAMDDFGITLHSVTTFVLSDGDSL